MRKWIVVTAVVLVVLVAGAAVAVRVFFPPEKMRAMIAREASKALGTEVTLEDAKASLFPLGADVRGLVIQNFATDAPPLLTLPEGNVTVKFRPLLSRRVEIARVDLKGPEITVVLEAKPAEGEEAAPPPAGVPTESSAIEAGAKGGSSFALLLSSASLEEGTLHILDRTNGAEYDAEGVNATTSLALDREGKVTTEGEVRVARVTGTALAAIGYGDGITELGARYDVGYDPAAGTAVVRSLLVEAGKLGFALEGEASGLPDSLRADLRLSTSRVELAELLSVLPGAAATAAADFEGSGPISLAGAIHIGPESPPSFRFAVDLGGLDVRNKKFSEAVRGLTGKIEVTENRLALDGLAGTLGDRPFSVGGAVENFADPSIDLTIRADVDLAALGRAGLLLEGVTVGGVIDADVRARGRAADATGIALDGSVTLDKASLAMVDPAVTVSGVTGKIVLAGREAKADKLRFDLNGSPTTLSASVKDPLGDLRATFDLATKKLDMNRFLPAPKEGAAPGGAAAFSSKDPPPIVLPPFPPITIAGKVKADTILTGVNVLTGAEATMNLDHGVGDVKVTMTRGDFGGVRVKKATGVFAAEDGALAGDLAADSAVAYRVPLTSVKGKLAFGPDGVLTLDQVRANVFQGAVAGDASVALNTPGGATYRFTAQAENLEANDFLTTLTPARDVLFGRFRLESTWSGRGLTEEQLLRSLTADGTMKAADGHIRNLTALNRAADLLGLKELQQVTFRDFWSKFSVADGLVRFDDLLIHGDDADWNASGAVGFDGALDYDVTLTLSKAISDRYKQKSALTGLFADPSGRVVLDVHVGGTSAKPNLTLDASKTAQRAGAGNLQGVIENLQKDENVQKAIGDLLGGKKPSLDGIFGGSKKEAPKPAPKDTTKAAPEDTTAAAPAVQK